jgi:hypothetical protein
MHVVLHVLETRAACGGHVENSQRWEGGGEAGVGGRNDQQPEGFDGGFQGSCRCTSSAFATMRTSGNASRTFSSGLCRALKKSRGPQGSPWRTLR